MPGSPSSATRSAASGRRTTTWALAAVEALRADGRAGKVPVTGIDGIQLAVEAILKGEMAGTVAWDPFWQGGMGLSIGYHAKTGKFDPSKEPKEHREFYGTGVIITADNAQSFYDSNIKAEPTARLERHLGPRQRADPVQLIEPARARSRARRASSAITDRGGAPASPPCAGRCSEARGGNGTS